MRAVRAALTAVGACAALAPLIVQAQNLTAEELKFRRNPATGSEIAVVHGDPSKPGPFILRVRYPDGLKAMPHSHPADTYVTVLEGTLYFAEGQTFDESKLKAYPAGSFIFEKANAPHYQMAKGTVVFQAQGTGPNAFNFVDPQHEQRNQKK